MVDHRKEPSRFARQNDRQDAVVEEAPGDPHPGELPPRRAPRVAGIHFSRPPLGAGSGISESIEGHPRGPNPSGTAGVLAGLLINLFHKGGAPSPPFLHSGSYERAGHYSV